MTWILMYCFWKEIAYSFNFLKRLKHIILGADYMKYNLPVNRAGLRTTTNCSLILHETFTSLKRWWAFQDTFEIKWKQPATEISSEFFFFSKNCWKSSATACFIYQQWTTIAHIFQKVPTTYSLVFFSKQISRKAVLTQASVITCK